MAGIDSAFGFDAAPYVPFAERAARAGGAAPTGGASGGSDFAETLERMAKKTADSTAAGQSGTRAGRLDKEKFSDEEKKLYEQCEALETFLVKNMLSGMRKTVTKSNLLDTGFAGEMYEDMLWDEYAKDYTQKARFGLAELAFLELTHQR